MKQAGSTALQSRGGFTLIELLITLTILTVLTVSAIPGFTELISKKKVGGAANTLIAHLQLARSDAIKRNRKIVLCPSLDGRTCEKTIEWQNGYILFVDEDEDGLADAAETHILYHQPGEASLWIRSSTSENGRKKVTFYPTGMSPGSNITFTVCDLGENADPKAVIISRLGRIRISTRRPDNSPIACV